MGLYRSRNKFIVLHIRYELLAECILIKMKYRTDSEWATQKIFTSFSLSRKVLTDILIKIYFNFSKPFWEGLPITCSSVMTWCSVQLVNHRRMDPHGDPSWTRMIAQVSIKPWRQVQSSDQPCNRPGHWSSIKTKHHNSTWAVKLLKLCQIFLWPWPSTEARMAYRDLKEELWRLVIIRWWIFIVLGKIRLFWHQSD